MEDIISAIAIYFDHPSTSIIKCAEHVALQLNISIDDVYHVLDDIIKEQGIYIPDDIKALIFQSLGPRDFIKLCAINRSFREQCGTVNHWLEYLKDRSVRDWLTVMKYLAIFMPGSDVFNEMYTTFETKLKEYDYSKPLWFNDLYFTVNLVDSDIGIDYYASRYAREEIVMAIADTYPLPSSNIYVEKKRKPGFPLTWNSRLEREFEADSEFDKTIVLMLKIFSTSRENWTNEYKIKLNMSIMGRMIKRAGLKPMVDSDLTIIHNILHMEGGRIEKIINPRHKSRDNYYSELSRNFAEYIGKCMGRYMVFPSDTKPKQIHELFLYYYNEFVRREFKHMVNTFFTKLLAEAKLAGNTSILEAVAKTYRGKQNFCNDLGKDLFNKNNCLWVARDAEEILNAKTNW
jgi:hypothetical protein